MKHSAEFSGVETVISAFFTLRDFGMVSNFSLPRPATCLIKLYLVVHTSSHKTLCILHPEPFAMYISVWEMRYAIISLILLFEISVALEWKVGDISSIMSPNSLYFTNCRDKTRCVFKLVFEHNFRIWSLVLFKKSIGNMVAF